MATVAVVLGGLFAASPAMADSAPANPNSPSTPTTVTADALPTPQIDGVVWSQKVVGNVVYAGGNWSTIRPYGSPLGTNTISQPDLLAYNLTTGALITTFNPQLNGQVKAVAMSPDNSVLYVGGQFTTVNGSTAYRIAALNPTTGALIKTFNAAPNATVNAIAAYGSTVYIGGNFSGVGNSTRTSAAALSASTGALLPWSPNLQGGTVSAIAIDPDGSKVILGGSFTSANGSTNPGYGIGAFDPTSAALLPWNMNSVVQDGGVNAGITSLTADSTGLYGSGYVYGSGGNVEGSFRADWSAGNLTWLESCHGDTYSTAVTNDAEYLAGHPHYCGDVGGFPQAANSANWVFHRGLAFSLAATQTTTTDPYQPAYANFAGQPAPSLLNWFPDFNTGTFTGQSQGPWSVGASSNSQYVVYGGEFTTVNGVAQQGLTRFAVSSIAPNKQGPMVTGANFTPSVVSLSAGTARVAWTANWDRDNTTLTYNVYRNGGSTPVYTTTANSSFWNLQQMGFVDKGLTPGVQYSYRVSATDPFGNTVKGDSAYVTIASNAPSNYVSTVASQGASSLWRFNEASGNAVYDNIGYNDMQSYGGLTRGATGSASDGSTSSTFNGTGTSYAATQTAVTGPQTFSVEAWINTTSTSGGVIAGFGDQNTTTSSNYDRHLYMDTNGHVNFGTFDGNEEVLTSPTPLNDGKWHQVIGTLSSAGLTFYVDGKLVGSNPNIMTAQPFTGYWRVGGDSTWSGADFFTGNIDDVSIYPTALSRTQVNAQWVAAGNPSTIPTAPKDAYGNQVYTDSPILYYRLDDAAGSASAADSSISGSNGIYNGGVTQGVPGALANNSGTAATFDGSSGTLSSSQSYVSPETFSVEAWFKTTTTSGGKIIGFGQNQTALSPAYDRHVYMQNNGQLVFGVWNGQENMITTPGAYNDGAWHHVVGTMSSSGLALYVDGQLIGTNPTNYALPYTGYWRIGGDNTWGSSSPYFAGTIDEAAVYNYALTGGQVASHYALGTGGTVVTPTSSFTATPSGLSVAFDGTGSSEQGGSIASYAWSFGDGSASTSAKPTYTYARPGTYTVGLTVTDANGVTASSSQQVTVTSPAPPTASFTTTPTNLSVAFDGSGSTDASGTISSYSWTFGDGTTGSGVTPTHVYASAGTYPVELTVMDSNGLLATSTAQVTVTKALVPPTASFTATPTNLTTAFDGTSSSDINGTITSYAWNFGDGSTGTGAMPTHTYTGSGTYTVQLTVKDSNGLTGTASQSVTVAAPILPPTAAFTETATNLALAVNGTSSTIGSAAITGYAWNFGDGGTATGSTANHTYSKAGTYTVSLTVTDANGKTATASQSVTVTAANIPPTASFVPTLVGQTLSVDGTGSTDPDGTVASWAWNFGDGTTATGSTASHTYAKPGTYTVSLTVTDNQGATGTATQSVTIVAVPPTASFTTTTNGLTVSANGTGSTATGATIASYAWNFGDGSTATGSTASHAYTSNGTYTVSLTVTDSNGLTSTSTQSVTVNAAVVQPFALDTFNRTVTSGWGSANTGGAWTKAGSSSNLSVSNNAGNFLLPTAGTQIGEYLYGTSQTTSNLLFSFTLANAPTGNGTYVSAIPRAVSTNNEYRAQVRFLSSGAVGLSILGYEGSSTATTLVAEKTISGLTGAASTSYSVRVEAVGTSPTTIRARVWVTGTPEPTTWQVTTTDSYAGLQTAGGVGALAYLSGSATSGQTVSISQLSATTTP